MTWFKLSGTTLDAPDIHRLADFYRQLLDWEIDRAEPDWITIRAREGGGRLSFQSEPDHVPPAWPAGPGDQQMQIHLDIEVDDLVQAGAHASSLGAELAAFQPQDDVHVYLDPAGHPFCLWTR